MTIVTDINLSLVAQLLFRQLLSCVQLFVTPWTVAHQPPPSIGFSKQEYWGGLPFPSSCSLVGNLFFYLLLSIYLIYGLPRWLCGKEYSCQGRRQRFDPWFGKIPRRRKWHPAPVFLPGEFHGQRRLVGYSPWGHKELDMTERLNTDVYLIYNIYLSIYPSI